MKLPQLAHPRILAGVTAAAWTTTFGLWLGSAVLNSLPDLPYGTILVSSAVSLAATFALLVERVAAAIGRLDRNAITPVREAFLHGVEYAQQQSAEQRSTGDAQIIAIPRQVYTSSQSGRHRQQRTADGTTTVELERLLAARRAARSKPRPYRR